MATEYATSLRAQLGLVNADARTSLLNYERVCDATDGAWIDATYGRDGYATATATACLQTDSGDGVCSGDGIAKLAALQRMNGLRLQLQL